MYYTQRDGQEYHYISDTEFDKLFEKAVPYKYDSLRSKKALGRYATLGPYDMLLQVHEDRERFKPLARFDSGDGLKEGDLAWEMEAMLYTYTDNLNLLMVRELYYDDDKVRCYTPRWYLLDKEEEE